MVVSLPSIYILQAMLADIQSGNVLRPTKLTKIKNRQNEKTL